jgi:protein-disulfide isomerase
MMKLNRRAMIALAAAATAAMTPALAQETTTATTAPTVGDYSVGSADAKVKIVEYASFTCPHCAHFHETVWPSLKTDYIDTGKVHFTLREVYFDRPGLWAAIIARCGGEMKYFGIHDMLFAKQAEWAGTDDPNQIIENLKTIGRSAGLEDSSMDACLKDEANATAMIEQYKTNFAADGVEGTPTLFINGTKYSNMAYSDLKAILDAELAK